MMASSHEDTDQKVKVTVVGDGAVGKTSLLFAYLENKFDEDMASTTLERYQHTTIVDGETVFVDLWDTAGQEDFNRLRMLSYPGTDAIILCYSATSRTSFENIKSVWCPELKYYCPRRPMILLATKKDIRDESDDQEGFVSTRQGTRLAKDIKAVGFEECSAKKMENITRVIDLAITAAINRIKKDYAHPSGGCCNVL